jgi:tellurite resistance protein TehA-like permease
MFKSFIPGFTLFFWATATWWIPLLVLVGIWRHIGQRLPLSYDPQYWSLVFPLGMYSSASFAFAEVTGLPFLHFLARWFSFFALLAWLVTFLGLLGTLVPISRAGQESAKFG